MYPKYFPDIYDGENQENILTLGAYSYTQQKNCISTIADNHEDGTPPPPRGGGGGDHLHTNVLPTCIRQPIKWTIF